MPPDGEIQRTIRGSAGALHDRPIGASTLVEVLQIDAPAVVLGSTQSFDVVDPARAAALGFAVVRRRSGGGVVVLRPGDHVWVDVTVPRGHRLWSDDVERATWWLGEVWCEVLHSADASATWAVHHEKLVATAPERTVCFAAVGPGEVVRMDATTRTERSADGARSSHKVVGISQRRTKDAARFQCTVFRSIDLELHAALLRDPVPVSLTDAAGVNDLLEIVAAQVVGQLANALS